MHFSKTVSLLTLGLAIPARAAMFIAYSGDNCSGDGQEVNVWDNTCCDWPNDFRSVRVTVYGGKGQRVSFDEGNVCYSGGGPQYWADGGASDAWKIGNCLNMGTTCSAIRSFLG